MSNPSKVYYDIQIANYASDSTAPPFVLFNEVRESPLITDASLYEMSIVRFQLDTLSIPCFTSEIQLNQPNPNLTVYSMTMSYKGVDSQQTYINWIPQNQNAPVPTGPSLNNSRLPDNTNFYYDIYNYQWFVDLVNTCFVNCFTSLQTNVGIAGLMMPTSNIPFMIFDCTTNSAIISCDVEGFQTNTANPLGTGPGGSSYIQIFFNASLFNLFYSFNAILLGNVGIQNGKNNLIKVLDTTSGLNTLQIPIFPDPTITPYISIQVVQLFSTIGIWTPISSIVFCSNTLPIYKNSLANPLIYYDGVNVNVSSTGANYANIITDMISDGQYSPTLLYQPAVYRMISLNGSQPIKNIDVQVYYKNKLGMMTPFRLLSNCSSSIKIMFSKKNML